MMGIIEMGRDSTGFANKIKLLGLIAAIGVGLAGGFVFEVQAQAADDYSQYQVNPPRAYGPIQSGWQIMLVVGTLARWLAMVFWIAAIASAFYAGYLYLFAAGNQEMVKKANKQIWYTIIAIVIGLMAWGLPALIKNLLSTPSTTTPPPPGRETIKT